jgi:hypothetical protein
MGKARVSRPATTHLGQKGFDVSLGRGRTGLKTGHYKGEEESDGREKREDGEE